MAEALKEAETLSPTLLDAKTEAMRDDWIVSVPEKAPGGGLTFMGRRFTTGAAYVEAVEAQANAQREAAAARILAMVNGRTQDLSNAMKKNAEDVASPSGGIQHDSEGGGSRSSSRNGGSTWGYGSEDGYGRGAGRNPGSGVYPGGFDQPWWSEADAAAARHRVVASGAVATQEPGYGQVGSRTDPITDPQDLMGTDLLHTRVNGTAYRNGVVGGHTPAPPADADHPLWRLNGGAASDSSVAGRLGGVGVLGAGALGVRGAARMGSTGLGGGGGLTGGLTGGARGLGGGVGLTGGVRGVTGGVGASALKVGSYSGSGFGSYTPPAPAAGAGGVGGVGVSGSAAAPGAGANGAGVGANGAGASGAGANGAGANGAGGFMGGAGAGAGGVKDEKKARRRRYVAFRVDDEDEDALPVGYVNPLSQVAGSEKDIAPAKRVDDGWDPRQW